MKNIHIIKTDKPSRIGYYTDPKDTQLYILSNGNKIGDYKPNWKPQNTYITNDEEIREGNWCLDKFNQRWKLEDERLIAFDSKGIKRFSTDNILGHDCKKIILTTDTQLIQDGVQAIDDEFLEWFVKNPSCEYVKTDSYKTIYHNWLYKIIIPIEDPKQQCKDCNKSLEECTCIEDTIDMKQETPEENKIQEIVNYFKTHTPNNCEQEESIRQVFIDETKEKLWAEEKGDCGFSEEYVFWLEQKLIQKFK